MIQVLPIQEKALQAQFCALCSIPYRAEQLAYAAYDAKGNFVGMCQFYMNAEGGHLTDLALPTKEDPLDALFVLGRTALNFIDLCGIKLAFFEGTGLGDPLLSRIGFSKNEQGNWAMNLEGFFTKGCSCGH